MPNSNNKAKRDRSLKSVSTPSAQVHVSDGDCETPAPIHLPDFHDLKGGADVESQGETARQRRRGFRKILKLQRERDSLKQELESGTLNVFDNEALNEDIPVAETNVEALSSENDDASATSERDTGTDCREARKGYSEAAIAPKESITNENTTEGAAHVTTKQRTKRKAVQRLEDLRAAEELEELQFDMEFLKNIKQPPSKRALRESIVSRSPSKSNCAETNTRSAKNTARTKELQTNSNASQRVNETSSGFRASHDAASQTKSRKSKGRPKFGHSRNVDVSHSVRNVDVSHSVRNVAGTEKDVMSLSYRMIRSDLGLSRRECDRLIWGGRVSVNGEIAQQSRGAPVCCKSDLISSPIYWHSSANIMPC